MSGDDGRPEWGEVNEWLDAHRHDPPEYTVTVRLLGRTARYTFAADSTFLRSAPSRPAALLTVRAAGFEIDGASTSWRALVDHCAPVIGMHLVVVDASGEHQRIRGPAIAIEAS